MPWYLIVGTIGFTGGFMWGKIHERWEMKRAVKRIMASVGI